MDRNVSLTRTVLPAPTMSCRTHSRAGSQSTLTRSGSLAARGRALASQAAADNSDSDSDVGQHTSVLQGSREQYVACMKSQNTYLPR